MRWRMGFLLVLLGYLPVGIAGCGGGTGGPTATLVETGPTTALAEIGIPESGSLVLLARQDLSRRVGVPENEIRVQSTIRETWRDTSLGCPEPGKSYAQVLTPGYRIVLEARGDLYEYHSDSGRVVFCQGKEDSKGKG